MAVDSANAPSWLFSFVDLAFLLLIAMTQIADPNAPDLGEMILPRIEEEAVPQDLSASAGESWQLRIHPYDPEQPSFELRSSADPGAPIERVGVETLRESLVDLRDGGTAKPMLAPHADSRSQDMLDAAAAIEEHWPNRRRVTVTRLAAGR